MLPTFQVRGLRCFSADAVSGDEERWADVQLDNELQYDQLIQEHPETALSYVDDDDGEIITVGSSEELFARIDELHPLTPVIFDLFVSPSHPKYETAIKLWGEILQSHAEPFSKDKEKEKPKTETLGTGDTGPSSVTRSGILVDLSDDSSSSSKESVLKVKEDTTQQPLLSMFESELEKIFQTTTSPFPSDPETSAPRQPSPSPPLNDPQPYPSEVLGQTLRTIAQNIGRVAVELRNDLPSHAQPTVEALNSALHSAIGTFTTQLQNVALDAAAAARSAAQATMDMDVSELEATGRRMKELAETVGHIAVQGANVAKDGVGNARDNISQSGWNVTRATGKATGEPGRAGSEVGGSLGEVVAEGKGKEKEPEKEERSGNGSETEQSKMNEPKSIWELIQEASESSRTERTPINIADAVNIPAGAQESIKPNIFADSSSDDDDSPEEIPGGFGSRSERDNTSRRRRHFDPLRPQGGHVDGPARSNTFSHWSSGHHMFHPRHPRHGRHGPHHGGSPPHHPHFGMPGAHHPHHPHHPPPPPPHHSPHSPHHAPCPPSPPPPPPPPPPPHNSHNPHWYPHPPPPPPPAPPSFFPHHPFHQTSPFWGGNRRSSNSSVPNASNPLDEFVNIRFPSGVSVRSEENATVGRSEDSTAEWGSDYKRQESESPKAPPPLFPFIRRANTIGSAIRDRGKWAVSQPSAPGQARDHGKFIPPVAAMPPIPSAQHVMRRFPSLSSLHSSSSGQSAAGLRAQASVPNFRSQQRNFSADIGQNPFATPPRQASPVSEQAVVPDAPKPEGSESRVPPGGWPQPVLIPPPPPPAPMDAFTPRGLHRANTIATPARGARDSFLNPSQSNETNPFAERRRRRENRMNREDSIRETDDQSYYSHRSVPGTFPPEQQIEKPQKNINAENDVDMCIAQLVDMGYGESESALERLKVFAQIAEGSILDAVEMLEEERQAWSQRME